MSEISLSQLHSDIESIAGIVASLADGGVRMNAQIAANTTINQTLLAVAGTDATEERVGEILRAGYRAWAGPSDGDLFSEQYKEFMNLMVPAHLKRFLED